MENSTAPQPDGNLVRGILERSRSLRLLLASVSHSPLSVMVEPDPTHIFVPAALGMGLRGQVGLGAWPGRMTRH